MSKDGYSYLTDKEAEMSRQAVNMQIILGLQTCKTKGDVEGLLNDIRKHERSIVQGKSIYLPGKLVGDKPPVCPNCKKPMELHTKFVHVDIWYRCPDCLRVDSQQFTFGDKDINE